MKKIKLLIIIKSGGGAGGQGGICPSSFGDLFIKFWEFVENSFFAIYCPPIKNFSSAHP